MQIIRTIFWVALLVAFVILTVLNWNVTVAMEIWPDLFWDTRLPAIVVAAFLAGMVPTWLLHRGVKWRLTRRIGHLEAAAKAQAQLRAGETAPTPVTSTSAVEPVTPAPSPAPGPGPGPAHSPDRIA